MKKILMIFIICSLPVFCFAEWSAPVWTDDCVVTIQKDEKGRMTTWIETCYDQYGKQTSKRTDTYTYYEKGDIDEIEQKVYDSKDTLMSDQKTKHYLDGKQPITSDVSIGEVSR